MHCAQLPTAQLISPLRAHLPETSRPGKLVYLGQAQRQQAACKALDFGIGRHQIRLAQPASPPGSLNTISAIFCQRAPRHCSTKRVKRCRSA